ncbi:uncharacterized protein A4U43_C05F35490 [Asparagus officinalis]|uniref:PUM-HD domain-containing protein n=1 Tax=Asparagus officinalis TaxID=4686 RepID=A0A5P1EWZ6_ASPOF|nr:pumilio homolog 5 [Asparagus officinalis]XP_020265929.1 pumilio homolog 5 [Asparagus officinalis]XP_020265930.1 pumilio homolog 5 [Asparagus officinalis]XP_020265931.1 pumilio homolog 5 [Asparagus officinalis]ONK70605.1 uncharacterized protein A4U43_C05F35490 [Asparagus officinalis]
MTTESPMRIIGGSRSRNWPSSRDATSYTSSASNMTAQELGMLLQGHSFNGNREFTGPNRSGSAPPSMEGSSLAIGDLRRHQNSSLEGIIENLTSAVETSESEEQLRSDPAYLAYYHSNVNLNPRLPQPLLSRDNRRLVHNVGALGEDWRVSSFDDSTKEPFVSRPALAAHEEKPQDDKSPKIECDEKAGSSSAFVSGQHTSSLQGRHKSLVDLIQEDFPRTPSPIYSNQTHPSRHSSTEPIDLDALNSAQDSSISMSVAESKTISHHAPIACVQSAESNPKHDVSASLLMPSSAGQKGQTNTSITNMDCHTSVVGASFGSIEDETKNLRISNGGHRSQLARQHPQQSSLQARGSSFQARPGHSLVTNPRTPNTNNSADHFSHGQSKLPASEVQPALVSAGVAPPLYAAYGASYHPNLQPSSLFAPQLAMGSYALNTSLVPPFITGYSPYGAVPVPLENATPNFGPGMPAVSTGYSATPMADMQNLYKLYGQLGIAAQPSFPDPIYMSYFQHPSVDPYAGIGQYDHVASRGSTMGGPLANYDQQRGQVHAPDHRPQSLRTGSINVSGVRKDGNASPDYPGGLQNVAVLMQYPTSPLGSPIYQGSPVASASPSGRRNDNMRFSINSPRTGGAYSGWQGQRGREKFDEQKPPSFLEELKSSKSRRYELSDIVGRIVEFSADQHGSRFIQQKLETCTIEEKAAVFQEVLPHASTLMTDVFGNYVIQKFFEYGSPEQRKELANKLVGHVLPLSLQMYGCRVIQKALEVIDLEQKTQLVHELDGHVMRCVRDQNGNHVIQKCIECIPSEKIDFIISAFRGNVASLSMHPYGCRVIQRVLEHCTDEVQSQCIVDEILQSACTLAQDQYGNYVTQHVLEGGKSLERSQIIKKLAGQVVQMSQHKFASNVIEKCLEHGSSAERDLLIEEIVGQTEGNDNLLVMMKDQFANYVVQKILETCNDKQREILLNRAKVHLQALKKYTYGKHIVARVEQLCGEEANYAAES